MHTAGWVTQDQPNSDGQIFISANDSALSAGLTIAAAGTSGYIGPQIPAATAGATITQNISSLLLRTGILNSNTFSTNRSQEAFGTANGPGPSSVAGTSGPSAFGPSSVIAPVLKANLATLIGSKAGSTAKGIQINWIDILYHIATANATSITAALSQLTTAVGADATPTSAAIIAATALSLVFNSTTAKMHRQRLTPPTLAMLIADGSTLQLSYAITTPAASVVTIAGAILGVSYNFN